MTIPLEIVQSAGFSDEYDKLRRERDELFQELLDDWKMAVDWALARNPRIGEEVMDNPDFRVAVFPETGQFPSTRVLYKYVPRVDRRPELISFDLIEVSTSEEEAAST